MPDPVACLFCRIVRKELEAYVVHEDERTISFLDHRPLFPGHVLVIPRVHHETLANVPVQDLGPLFARVQTIARALEAGLGAEGSFVAMNNRISQSVPHLHVHVVPRRRKDGLKGFFWPRQRYANESDARAVVEALQRALREGGQA